MMEKRDGGKSKEKKKNKGGEYRRRKSKAGEKQITSSRVKDVFDHWVLVQLLSIFAFSFAMGMLFMHATILWHQYKHGYGYWGKHTMDMERVFREHMESRFSGVSPQIYEWSHGQLRVNTSIFVR